MWGNCILSVYDLPTMWGNRILSVYFTVSPQCGETVYFPFILRLFHSMLRHFLLGYMHTHSNNTRTALVLERMAISSTTGFTTEPDEFPVALSVAMHE